MSREQRIYLAYTASVKALAKEELDRIDARAILHIAQTFALSPLAVQRIVKAYASK
jgi:hypothetical protein